MFSFDPGDKRPIYQQITDQLILMTASGMLKNGDQLPSIRELAGKLGINPNTVARAYSELEKKGVIVTVPKKGTYVAKDELTDEIEEKARQEWLAWHDKYRKLGLTEERMAAIIKEAGHAEN